MKSEPPIPSSPIETLTAIAELEDEMPGGGGTVDFYRHQLAHAQNLAEDAVRQHAGHPSPDPSLGCRASFQKWWSEQPNENVHINSAIGAIAWDAFQAASKTRAHTPPDMDGLIEEIGTLRASQPWTSPYLQAIDDCLKIIRSHGAGSSAMGAAAPDGVLSREEDRQKPCPAPASIDWSKCHCPSPAFADGVHRHHLSAKCEGIPSEIRLLKQRLAEIQQYAGSYIGCRCDRDDCDPGDCWPCRMMAICDLANPEDEDLGPTEPVSCNHEYTPEGISVDYTPQRINDQPDERTELSERAPAKRIDEILTQPYVVLKAGRINYEVRRDFLQLATEVKHLRLDLAEATKREPGTVWKCRTCGSIEWDVDDKHCRQCRPKRESGFLSECEMALVTEIVFVAYGENQDDEGYMERWNRMRMALNALSEQYHIWRRGSDNA